MKIISILFILFAAMAHAEIEKVAQLEGSTSTPCKGELCFYWWPKLTVPKGWHQDKTANYQIGANVFALEGYTFSNSESIIYARAIYKPRRLELKSLKDLIESDKKEFLAKYKGIKINSAPSLKTFNNQKLETLNFFPEKEGNWEQVAYGNEGDFYILFTLSSKTKNGFDRAKNDFKKVISKYK